MVLFAAWGLFRIIRGTSAPNATARQLLIGAVSMILFGALGAALLISAIVSATRTNPAAF